MLSYISAKEAAQKWNISQRRVAILCAENRIEGAMMVGKMWIIPSNATKPDDKRISRGIKEERKFLITIQETISQNFEVFANNEEDAQKIAIQKYKNEEVVLSQGNIINKQICIKDEEGVTNDWYEF